MMASHTPIYQKRGSTVVPVITIDDAPSSSANAAGHLVDSNGIFNAIAAVEAKIPEIPDLEGVKDILVSGTTMTVTYIDDSTKTFTLAVSSSTTGPTYSDFTGATASAAGSNGLVPAPAAGKQASFLRGDGKWGSPANMTGASTSAAGKAGFVPAPTAGAATRYLRSDGTWAVPPDTNTTYSNMTAATASAAGTAGLVPAPAAGKQTSFLRGDGTWATPPDTNTTYSNMKGATTSAAGTAGLVPAPAKGRQDYYLKGDGTWVAASWLPLTGGTLANTSGAAGTNNATALAIGNNKSIDAAGNTYGRLVLWGKTNAGDAQAYNTRITPSRFTANRTHTLPNASGYLAVGSTSGVGNATTPVYMSSAGVLTACSGLSSAVSSPVSRVLNGQGTKLWSKSGGLDNGDITLSHAFTDFNFLVLFFGHDDRGELDTYVCDTAALNVALSASTTYWPGAATDDRSVPIISGLRYWLIHNYAGGTTTRLLKHWYDNDMRLFSIWGVN